MAINMEGFVRICDKGDYKAAYDDYVDFEMGFDEEFRRIISYEEFVTEIKKGYDGSEILQIARLMETDDGIYYDNDFAR